ncbi:hypothetical protein LCGC14_0176320 [marine sediment metagenome]|uniref:Uncharacterized protein n=1 Tax=marine sediment metagenome TaxID=412755 RepID=A0A0F9XTZ5_9ZZZZ
MKKYELQDNMGLHIKTNDFKEIIETITFHGVIHVSGFPAYACGTANSYSCEHGVGTAYELFCNDTTWEKLKELGNQ